MFVGIDWSGDKKSFQSGIAVATATVGVPSPVIVQRRWSRDSVVKWLCEQANERRILVGIDFAFAHPFVDRECYYPGFGRAPRTPCELWAFVDRVAAERPNFYAAEPIRDSEVGDWYQFQGRQNARYAWRLRGTENAAAQCKGVSPKNTFNAIGRSVAEGSLAGMRVLHYLHKEHRDLFRIWPMEDICSGKSAIVEIYPTFYRKKGKFKDGESENEHERDALLSAEAIRHYAQKGECWNREQCANAKEKEGWIFGVPPFYAGRD